jgi:hypothetical protein
MRRKDIRLLPSIGSKLKRFLVKDSILRRTLSLKSILIRNIKVSGCQVAILVSRQKVSFHVSDIPRLSVSRFKNDLLTELSPS